MNENTKTLMQEIVSYFIVIQDILRLYMRNRIMHKLFL